MYSLRNFSNINVSLLEPEIFNIDSSNFNMIMFIIACIVFLYVILLFKYNYDKGSLIILG